MSRSPFCFTPGWLRGGGAKGGRGGPRLAPRRCWLAPSSSQDPHETKTNLFLMKHYHELDIIHIADILKSRVVCESVSGKTANGPFQNASRGLARLSAPGRGGNRASKHVQTPPPPLEHANPKKKPRARCNHLRSIMLVWRCVFGWWRFAKTLWLCVSNTIQVHS